MSDKISHMIQILKGYQPKSPSSYKLYLESELNDKQMNHIFKGLKLPVLYDSLLGFWDTSIITGNCTAGVLFAENGCYISRMWDTAYYVEYTEICSYDACKDSLKITVGFPKMVEVSCIDNSSLYLRDVLRSLQSYAQSANRSPQNYSGPVKDVKDLISGKDYASCQKIIHVASVACGGIGAAPLVSLGDTVIITPIQIGMLIALGQVFNVQLDRSAALSILSSYAGSIAGRSISHYTIGLIPGFGNAVNAVTGFSLTEAIGWMFVRNYATGKAAGLKVSLNEAVQMFQKQIQSLSQDQQLRFCKDMETLSGQCVASDLEKADDVFFDVMARYAFAFRVDTEKIPLHYTEYLKDQLKKDEKRIDPASQAGRYYKKFCRMTFTENCTDFEQLADFTELFLEFDFLLHKDDSAEPVRRFAFDLNDEDPTAFFSRLSVSKKSDKTDRETLKKRMVYALTSLIYGYAVDREGKDN